MNGLKEALLLQFALLKLSWAVHDALGSLFGDPHRDKDSLKDGTSKGEDARVVVYDRKITWICQNVYLSANKIDGEYSSFISKILPGYMSRSITDLQERRNVPSA